MADREYPTVTGLGTDGGLGALWEALERSERRRTWAGRGLVVLALLAIVAAVLIGGAKVAGAGATDWYVPAESVSILRPAYTPAPGHGDSVHAVCDGPGMIEVGVHPWDSVARNMQVRSATGDLLVNVTSADHAELVALSDQPAGLRYAGHVYALAVELCGTPATTVPSTVPPITAPEPATTVPEPATTTTSVPAETTTTLCTVACGTAGNPGTTVTTADVQILTSTVARTLPATGSGTAKLTAIGAALVILGCVVIRYRSRNA